MAIDINTIITNFQPLYPANKRQIWTILKEDNPSLTDEIITHLLLSIEESKFIITVSPTTTEYEGEINHLSYQYNLKVNINNVDYYVYNFNQFCLISIDNNYWNVRTNVGDKTFSINDSIDGVEFIENPSINHIDNLFLAKSQQLNITKFKINNGIISIGNGFLKYCGNFNAVLTLPTSLTSIGNEFLYHCSNFNEYLIIPAYVASIGTDFLRQCIKFDNIIFIHSSSSLASIDNRFMQDCSSFNRSLTLPNSLTSIGDSFMRGCSAFNQSLTLPTSLASIGDEFLYGCSAFNQSLTLPTSLASIGGSFMINCSSFNQQLTLPNSLTSIGGSFMQNCDNFTSALIISKDINYEAFVQSPSSFATIHNWSQLYISGFYIQYKYINELKERFPNGHIGNYYRNIVEGPLPQTSFIAKETSLSYKYHLNLVLGEHDIKVYLVKENEVSMKFDKPITTILPDTSTGKLLIGNALKNLPADQLTETAIETKITAINFYNK